MLVMVMERRGKNVLTAFLTDAEHAGMKAVGASGRRGVELELRGRGVDRIDVVEIYYAPTEADAREEIAALLPPGVSIEKRGGH